MNQISKNALRRLNDYYGRPAGERASLDEFRDAIDRACIETNHVMGPCFTGPSYRWLDRAPLPRSQGVRDVRERIKEARAAA